MVPRPHDLLPEHYVLCRNKAKEYFWPPLVFTSWRPIYRHIYVFGPHRSTPPELSNNAVFQGFTTRAEADEFSRVFTEEWGRISREIHV